MVIRIMPGAGAQLASVIPTAVYPAQPEAVSVQIPPSPQALRAELLHDANNLVFAIAAILIGITAFTVVTTMHIAVSERRQEIGIARSLGRPSGVVAASFLAESAFLCLIGSAAGLLGGVLIARVVLLTLGWPYVVPPALMLLPPAGLLVGAMSGSFPAYQASRIDPAELLR
jgi:putative ABC transport system permease protein